jgi:predicted PurR-regulated permease PerM
MARLEGVSIGKFRIPSAISAFGVLLLFWALFFGIMSIVIPLFAAEIKVLSGIDYELVWLRFESMLNDMDSYLLAYGVLSGEDASSSQMLQNKIQSMFSVSDLTSVFAVIFNGLGNFGVAFFSISFITYFFLKEEGLFKRMIMVFVPKQIETEVVRVLGTSKHLLARYFIGITIQITLISTLVTIGLLILGVKNAFVIGIFAGFINIIPYLGPFIGASVGMLIALTTGLSLGYTSELLPLLGKVGAVFLTVQLLDNALFQPIIFSNSVKAHPLEIFLVISIGGMLGGVAAMILAIPGYTVLRIVAKEFLSEFKIVQDLTSRI